jgi:hypothetical protein
MSLSHLLSEIENGMEILLTGETSGQYWKTAFILCDNYSELTAKLFVLPKNKNAPNKRKNYHDILADVEGQFNGQRETLEKIKEIHKFFKEKREQRNNFFHSTSFLTLNVQLKDVIKYFCFLLDYGKLLFEKEWEQEMNSQLKLANLARVVRVKHISLTDNPSIQTELDKIFKNWKRANSRKKGEYLAEFPEDIYRRMVIIHGGRELAQKLQDILGKQQAEKHERSDGKR